jgi:hypothetical protein
MTEGSSRKQEVYNLYTNCITKDMQLTQEKTKALFEYQSLKAIQLKDEV